MQRRFSWGFLQLLIICCIVTLSGCGVPAGQAVVSVGPEGIQSYKNGKVLQTVAWEEVEGLTLKGHLVNAQAGKSAPVLRVRTESSLNVELASSYSERADSKSFGGMYVNLSIAPADLAELRETIVRSAGLEVHPEDHSVWVKTKDSAIKPPSDVKTYHKRIGS